ncbi:anthrax toxin-like adenylyl cyclase domain-containing protein [Paludibacterium sp.]|uniref:anthrax toxin-like adenylyl cyclase domain-containing protein n=1 Tax=Paludibacterium sp. TaxID=1917523 RepID=UPI0025D5A576|nr:anthrax toxin-like adenylyl cyclase domain-containing protein [Paludibacterium sp.]MBV8648192.1 hypothetical protein [Paludibacterium sp.]
MLKIAPRPHSIASQIDTPPTPTASPPAGIVSDRQTIERLTGLAAKHLAPLQQFAHDSGLIIAFRPVEQLATAYIDAGYPSKNFHIKGKSANWGPMAGLIPIDQALSKLAGQSARIGKFNSQTQQCLQEGHAVAGNVELPSWRLAELTEKGLIHIEGGRDASMLKLHAKAPDGSRHVFHAEKTAGGYRVTCQGEPVQVLCQPESGLPLTADYDLMLVAPSIEHYGGEDIPPIADVTYSHFQARVAGYKQTPDKLLAAWPGPKQFYAAELPELGNASARVRDLILPLNQALDCQPGRELVHHNMDATSPAADPTGNYPVTLFLPHALGGLSGTLLIEDAAALAQVITQAKNAGYQVPINPLWEPTLQGIRRGDYDHALTIWRQRG